MVIKNVARHQTVSERRIEAALESAWRQTHGHWHSMRYGDAPLRPTLVTMSEQLLDHVAARALEDPALQAPDVRTALNTSAECALGVLSLGCFPNGDFEISFPVIDERLSSEEIAYDESLEPPHPTTARTWLDAFTLCVSSGLVWEWERVIGLLLREDYAPAIRDGVPYAKRESISAPADIAEMDALCGYLTPARGHLPRDWPRVPLRKPSIDERLDAALALDAAAGGALTPDQRLLRVLLTDDQTAFERALADRLLEHHASVDPALDPDPAPRTLLPVGPLALAALAVQVHGWDLAFESDYLPASLLRAPTEVGVGAGPGADR
ncbi:immunity 49 family protein [Streptomyces apocyni]|uniref:immunity 49 family protein n=1 Tax=Streptomyces apocyni TaxID=2654677 RepID=UPI002D80944F|nr:immunity 49 family protein [Streptomyces apocyni]